MPAFYKSQLPSYGRSVSLSATAATMESRHSSTCAAPRRHYNTDLRVICCRKLAELRVTILATTCLCRGTNMMVGRHAHIQADSCNSMEQLCRLGDCVDRTSRFLTLLSGRCTGEASPNNLNYTLKCFENILRFNVSPYYNVPDMFASGKRLASKFSRVSVGQT